MMRRPHFDAQLHSAELGRPQQVQDQIREQTKETSVDRTIQESGINTRPESGKKRFLSWLVILIFVILVFIWWLYH